MRVVIQRVKSASVLIHEQTKSEIGQGLLLLVAFEDTDTDFDIDYAVRKITQMRIFSDENDKMNLSIQDIHGEILSVSQFTLYAETRKGNRPSFVKAGEAKFSEKLYEKFDKVLGEQLSVQTGEFGADMQVSLVNDGPVTIILDTKEARPHA